MSHLPTYDSHLRKNKSALGPPILLVALMLLGACGGKEGPTVGEGHKLNSGLITFLFPPPSEVTLPYRVDFSEISSTYDLSWRNNSVVKEDLSFDWFALAAPNGILDYGKLQSFECPDFTGFYTSEAGVQSIVETFQSRLLAEEIDIPSDGYSAEVQLEWCHLYFLRTSEGQTVALFHIGWYIGGYDRHHFFWMYLSG